MNKINRAQVVLAAFGMLLFANTGVHAQGNPNSEKFIEVQRLIAARQFDEAIKSLTNIRADGAPAVEKYLLLSRIYLETGAGIAAETAVDRARALGADYAATAVPFAKAMLVQGKYADALKAMRGVSIPIELQNQAYIVSGDANFALKNYKDAKRDYELARAIGDDNFQPYLGLSRLALRRSDLAGARNMAIEAEKRDPQNTMVQYTLGLIARYIGDLDRAESYFLEAVRLFPSNLMANIELASLRINQNRIEDAEAYLDKVYVASSRQPMALYLSGVILASKGEYQEAALLLNRARDITENYLPAIYVRGLVAYQLGNNEVAAESLERVLEVRPNNKAARMALAGTYTNQKRPRAALRLLAPLMQSEKDADSAVLSMAAAAAMAAGELERGRALYERVTKLQAAGNQQTVSGATSKLALAQFAEGNTEQAVATITSVSAGIDVDIREMGMLASMQLSNSDYEGARTTIAKIVETSPERALGYNMQGTLAFKEHRYAEAVTAYSAALDRNPVYYTALRNRGLANFRLGNLQGAETDLKRLLELQPNDARSKAVLGKTLLTLGKPEESVVFFREAALDLPKSIELSADYSQALTEAGNTTRAIEQARLTAKMASNKAPVLKRMGILLLDLGQPAAAERPLSRFVAFNPDSGAAHLLHGRALLSMGLYTGSKISFERASKATLDKPDTDVISWYLFAADVLADKQEPALKRLADLKREKRPKDVFIGIVGDLLLNSGQAGLAEEAYRAALTEAPSVGGVAIGLANALGAQGREKEAISVLQQFVNEQPADRFAREALGARYEKVGNLEAAAEQYHKILKVGVADAKIAAKLSSVYLELGDSRSIALVKQAFLIAPDDPFILDAYGWVLLQAGREKKKSLTALEKAVRRAPAKASYKYHLGMAYLANARTVDARRLLIQAINLDPTFDGADEARRQIAMLE